MELETRYYVIKISDARKYLTEIECEIADGIYAKVYNAREAAGKSSLECLCIEKDWPEYEPTLKLLSDRVDSPKNQPPTK